MTIKERLMAKVKVNETTDCWEWTASKNQSGYGQIRDGIRTLRANRVSYEIHCGEIPHGMQVLHRCDNRACINPHHLFLGTNADNMADRNTKERQARGGGNGRAKLSASDVAAIRRTTLSRKACAAHYGVSERQITHIRSGRSWVHLDEGFDPKTDRQDQDRMGTV
jgi:hypothetical protein